jgi:hypothetical protein
MYYTLPLYTTVGVVQGNRASKALDKAFEKVIAPAGLFELPTI